ncbi:hypothetical protein TIFTF001_020756 [Ficus carica]|uniref:Uncharacterized protein n=1 Tax=Ficus carica TaxID=3494 RepID=A0AA88AGP7_FICCA|nr:hypothetical protein TIFTF001_020756 [Ficus carica]
MCYDSLSCSPRDIAKKLSARAGDAGQRRIQTKITFPTHDNPFTASAILTITRKNLKFWAIVNRFTYGLAAKREIGSERPNVRSTRELAGGGDAALKPVVDRQGPASASFLAYPVDRPSPAMASVAAPCSPEI